LPTTRVRGFGHSVEGMETTPERSTVMRRNLAARAGRWSASHWKTATFGWLAFVVAAVLIGGAVGTKQLGANDGVPGESGRAEQILKNDFEQPAGELVLVQSSRLTTQSAPFAAAIGDIERRLAAVSIVTNIRSPLDPAHADQVSRNRHSAIVRFDVRGDPDTAADRVAPVVAGRGRKSRASGGLHRRIWQCNRGERGQ
jgi:putative drug exporter of the RND superfamily